MGSCPGEQSSSKYLLETRIDSSLIMRYKPLTGGAEKRYFGNGCACSIAASNLTREALWVKATFSVLDLFSGRLNLCVQGECDGQRICQRRNSGKFGVTV